MSKEEKKPNIFKTGDPTFTAPPPATQPAQAGTLKSYKPDTSRFTEIKQDSSITGIFINAKHIDIQDTRTKQRKEILVLKLKNEQTNEIYSIGAGAMLEQAWEQRVDEDFNGDETAAIEGTRGRHVAINRGKDTRTRDGNNMGVYELQVWD